MSEKIDTDTYATSRESELAARLDIAERSARIRGDALDGLKCINDAGLALPAPLTLDAVVGLAESLRD